MKVIATNMPDRFIECEWELSVKIQKQKLRCRWKFAEKFT